MNPEIVERIKTDAADFAARHRVAAEALLDIRTSSAAGVAGRLDAADSRVADTALNLINSGYFGLPRNAKSIPHAHEMMGGERLAQAALAAWAHDLLSAPLSGYDLPAGDLWRHALGVSIASENLAEAVRVDGGQAAFTAGIFHDIGKRVLGPYVAGASEDIERKTEEGISFEAAEAAVLGIDHAALSGRILSAWHFPRDLVEAVRWSHVPDGIEPPSLLADLLHVGNVLCLTIGIGMGKEGLKYKASPAATKRLNVKTGTLELVASHTLQWTNELADPPGAV
jgi:HD-like signal output (HDOD) protein